MPYIRDLQIAEEDAVALDRQRQRAPREQGEVKVAVIRLPHISNFDDFDPLAATPGVRLVYAQRPSDIAGAALAVIPGTKNTRDDLFWLKREGFAATIRALHAAGGSVIGVCGGFQMLGSCVRDPLGVEGPAGEEEGLRLLPLTTSFLSEKTARQVRGRVTADAGLLAGSAGTPIEGYEIHLGTTEGDGIEPAFSLEAGGAVWPDGAISNDGRILGTYVHGLFANDELRRRLVASLTATEARPARPGRA
jgi:adenosylcobyric acid synthase